MKPASFSTALAGWLAVISVLHVSLNGSALWPSASKSGGQADAFRVGFIPVTCHLTCPVTDFIHKNMEGQGIYDPVRFQGFPELKEAFLSEYLQATFILAPLAMKLREEGVPIKIVYLGHRDGSAMVVRKDSNIYRIEDLRGKKIAIPNRYSNQYFLIFRALRERGIKPEEITLVEMPPPDMPTALYAQAVDAITSGEPYMGQAELDGYGRVLYQTKDVWPGFISCVLAVREPVIQKQRARVQGLVDGIASSGKWLDQTIDHRMQAADFVAKFYYNQDPRLLRFVLSKPPDRVKYSHLNLVRKNFEEIETLGKEAGVLKGTAHFEDYADDSFVPDEAAVKPHAWEGAHAP
jgi:NitT/TauT family transport system substrate-binding protein